MFQELKINSLKQVYLWAHICGYIAEDTKGYKKYIVFQYIFMDHKVNNHNNDSNDASINVLERFSYNLRFNEKCFNLKNLLF